VISVARKQVNFGTYTMCVKAKIVNKKLVTLTMITCMLLSPLSALADDPDNVYLKKGDPAPFALIGFPLPRAERVRLMEIDFSTCTKRLDLSIQDNSAYEERVTNLRAEVKELREEVSKKSGFWHDFGGFIGGAATVLLLAFAYERVTR
jgi:hypothetical protein